ncbi:serine hydrolase domain-containing protein [Flavobacterium sp.]|uniref:serine hydrolase domain-containing protein n=1 Tax=Flavobacterium sp. TaxID=239 RepID=UPI002B4AC5EF|nr:serine hydrolase domain-containing protein [Flavobacterium sp.]HLP65795.1 serine hydrolase domain-containing protein [Flavobacterium sp.]
MKLCNKNNFILGFILAVCCFLNTLSAQNLDSKIDPLIRNEIKDPNGPGAAFLIAKKGEILYQKSFGKANIELNVDLGSEFVFQLGSMTKQFTAIAILMLEEQGKLKTHDLVSKYILDYPSGDKITLHHLLTHTSGIKDFTKMKSLRDIAQKEMSPKMMVDFFKNEPVDFAPGEKFDYNNSGYILLGHIIELVSGETYEDFIEKNIFQKIGMNQSCFATDRQIISKRAYGYQKKESGYVNKTVINYSVPFSSGALMSTLNDMLKWQNALNTNQLISAETAKKAFSKYKLNNGEEFKYGYGWHIRDINGIATREHGGSIFGYKTMGVYVPSLDVYVLGFTNCDCISPTQLTQDIAKLVLETEAKN